MIRCFHVIMHHLATSCSMCFVDFPVATIDDTVSGRFMSSPGAATINVESHPVAAVFTPGGQGMIMIAMESIHRNV